MFEKFGEFDSYEEIEQAAAAQREQGDEVELLLLAEENGLDREDAEDYYDGTLETLATPVTAALGKLAVESRDLKLGGVLLDWVDELRAWCAESEDLARAVRRKGRDLAGYIAATADASYEDRTVVDKRIVDRTRQIKKIAGSHEFCIGIIDKRARRRLAEEYYLGKEG